MEQEAEEAADSLDEDEIKESPAYIPKSGNFYMHDQRSTANDEEQPPVEEKKERTSRADAADKWSHDLYDERQQQPKSGRELEYK